MKIEKLHILFDSSSGITTDSRSIEENYIFFALKGDSFNGNKFAKKALDLGAGYVVIDEKEYYINSEKYILVDNVLETLQSLAAYHRMQFKIPVIAITGTNGKTTTKELLNAILETKFDTFATKGNFNNHIGVPLSLLGITKNTEIAIIEMGANHMGEIASYCEWVKPTLGFITNIGKAHLEGFGSFENIIKAKTELYAELKKNNKIIFYNDGDLLIKELVAEYTYKISYGSDNNVDTKVDISNAFPTVEIVFENLKMKTNLFGDYNIENITAAISVASYFDVSKENIKTALENYTPSNNRSEIKQINNNIVILDAYNANPTSVKAAISSFAKLDVVNKILIIGDMYELGENSLQYHQEIVNYINNFSFDEIVLVGNNFCKCKASEKFQFFKSTLDTKKWFSLKEFSFATVLIKGSRGMKMESIIG